VWKGEGLKAWTVGSQLWDWSVSEKYALLKVETLKTVAGADQRLKASVGEMRESGALEGDQAGAVGRQCHQTLVSEMRAIGDTDASKTGAPLSQLNHSFIHDVPTTLEVDLLEVGAEPTKVE